MLLQIKKLFYSKNVPHDNKISLCNFALILVYGIKSKKQLSWKVYLFSEKIFGIANQIKYTTMCGRMVKRKGLLEV